KHVAGGADIRHGRSARRRGAMVSMAGGAVGSGQVSPDCQRIVGNALVIVRELGGGKFIFLHALLIGVAAGAGGGDVDRIHRGTRIAGRTDIVDAVGVNADGNLGVTGGQAFSVNAGVILAELVSPQAGIVFAHESRVRMVEFGEVTHMGEG